MDTNEYLGIFLDTEDLRRELEETRQERDAYRDQASIAENNLKFAESELEDARDEIAQLEEEVSFEESSNASYIEDLEGQVDQLQQEVEDLREEIDDLMKIRNGEQEQADVLIAVNEELRAALSKQTEKSPEVLQILNMEGFVVFFYLLLRDKLTSGYVEEIILDILKTENGFTNTKYSNPHLETYARDIVAKLMSPVCDYENGWREKVFTTNPETFRKEYK